MLGKVLHDLEIVNIESDVDLVVIQKHLLEDGGVPVPGQGLEVVVKVFVVPVGSVRQSGQDRGVQVSRPLVPLLPRVRLEDLRCNIFPLKHADFHRVSYTSRA